MKPIKRLKLTPKQYMSKRFGKMIRTWLKNHKQKVDAKTIANT